MSENALDQLDIQTLAEVEITVSAELDTFVTTGRELLNLDVGSIVTVTKATGDNVNIYLGNVPFASGEVLVSEGMLGVRIAELKDIGVGLSTGRITS